MTTATPTKRPARLIANILYPDPRWSDEQRQMHRAARAIRDAMLDVRALYTSDVIRLEGPSYHAYLAWMELEREIGPLFAEKEDKYHPDYDPYRSDYCAEGFHNLCTDGACLCPCHHHDTKEES